MTTESERYERVRNMIVYTYVNVLARRRIGIDPKEEYARYTGAVKAADICLDLPAGFERGVQEEAVRAVDKLEAQGALRVMAQRLKDEP